MQEKSKRARQLKKLALCRKFSRKMTFFAKMKFREMSSKYTQSFTNFRNFAKIKNGIFVFGLLKVGDKVVEKLGSSYKRGSGEGAIV